jgi:vacuolar protein sorting-associated protein 13A/C
MQEEGAVGFIKGISTGVAGAIVKPMVGAIDLVTRTTEGIRNTATTFTNEAKVRVRPARFFSRDHVLRVFNPTKALGNVYPPVGPFSLLPSLSLLYPSLI